MTTFVAISLENLMCSGKFMQGTKTQILEYKKPI